ncbi:MAG TPA: hypothetical protein VFF00_10060 [Candidatus Elarobacter sp.]|nr:hypothetical protein [Candidatus Elarobacter sp.]
MQSKRRLAAALIAGALAGCGGGGSTGSSSLPPPPGTPAVAHAAQLPPGDTSVVVTWDHALLQAVRDVKPAPTVVSRALAVVHTAEYDAWAAYDPVATGTRLGAALRRPVGERTLGNKEFAVSFAAYDALKDLFPSESALFDQTLRTLGFDPADSTHDAVRVADAASKAVLDFRHADGSNQLGDLHPGAYSDYTGYAPVNTPAQITDPNRWQPLLVTGLNGTTAAQVFSTPQWGRVTPFALARGDALRPPPPPAYGSAQRQDEIDEMVQMSAALGDREKAIAEYWMDGPNSELPPGHWCIFADYVDQRDHHGLDEDVKLLFALANAEFDAGIAVWDAKRAYDSARPVTDVHYRYGGKTITAWAGPGLGARPIDGAAWEPYQPTYVVTPPFAEYLSGHSAFSSAGAEILKDFTGSDAFGFTHVVLAGSSRVEPGTTPASSMSFTYATFSDAADEAGMSRRYGGIHFRSGDLVSRDIGREVGRAVWAKAQRYFTGQI